jgi:hypothetical protein
LPLQLLTFVRPLRGRYNFNEVQVVSATTATRVDKPGQTGFFLLTRDVGYAPKHDIAAVD